MKRGDEVIHMRYGEAVIVDKNDIGIVIKITTEKGKIQLAADSQTTIDRFLVDNEKELKLKENN